jgi:putative phosphoesterase
MKIGVISDTHDDMEAIGRAVEFFNEKGVTHVIHAGDLVSPFTFEVLEGLSAQFIGIFGNNDGDRLLLMQKSRGCIHTQPHVFAVHGKRVVVVHEPDIVDALAESGHFDLVVYGHLHVPEIRRVKGSLVLNPGKAARLHKGASTLALLDTARMEAEIIGLQDLKRTSGK